MNPRLCDTYQRERLGVVDFRSPAQRQRSAPVLDDRSPTRRLRSSCIVPIDPCAGQSPMVTETPSTVLSADA